MARLTRKTDLLHVVEHAIRDSGWRLLYLEPHGAHPGRYQIFRDGESYNVRVYIWNITHGGGPRSKSEYRIQLTGIDALEAEPNGKTLILGWWHEVGVFAGFDFSHRPGQISSSPSIQIGEEALRRAMLSGFAPHNRGSGDLAIAFRPDFIGTYISNLESLHACGEVAGDTEILDQIADDPDDFDESAIENVTGERQYTVTTARRALRDMNFRSRVLTAYGCSCAFCGLQLKLLDAAHILPVTQPDSTDQTRNGVALCALHHRAYDRALITFDPDYEVLINEEQIAELTDLGHDGGLKRFKQALRPYLNLPPDKKDRPDPAFIERANELRGWAS